MKKQEAIQRIDDVLNSEYRFDETLGYQLTSDDFEWLEKAKNALKEQSDWVSVEVDTPTDSSERVQVFLRDADFTKSIGENKIDTDRYIDGKWVRWGKYVTHWKHLSDPPKEDSNETS